MTDKSAKQIIAELKQARDRRHGQDEEQAQVELQILPPPSAPMQVARIFVQRCCLYNGSAADLTLRYWHGGWWIWRTTHWVEVENREVRSLLYAFTEHAWYEGDKTLIRWEPTRRKIGDLAEALSAIVILSDEVEQPCWIELAPEWNHRRNDQWLARYYVAEFICAHAGLLQSNGCAFRL